MTKVIETKFGSRSPSTEWEFDTQEQFIDTVEAFMSQQGTSLYDQALVQQYSESEAESVNDNYDLAVDVYVEYMASDATGVTFE